MWIRVWQSRRVTTLPKQELQVPAQIRGAFNDSDYEGVDGSIES